ncbi:RNA recognition motif domain-containing protein [Paraglaciecola chathamensis]|uniref:RRM domain-containing protein n=1 Tax=Paraglaciecola chathamensis S18K6 TaxID=1127672 RepID=A0AAV3UX72_9ALTE|nr:hypothetical protein [Paraglaciecola chathamensis]GAC09697.1 hypothetical protein GCHA_1746 [Paraglaciecola chathamensis S18K6]
MNSPTIINIILSVVLAIAGYFLLPVIATNLDSNVAIAVGLLLGGILVPIISSQFSGAATVTEEADVDNSKTLYVGNLPYRANEQAVQQHFEIQGQVHSVRLMKDRRTGKRKGYGFVEMTAAGAEKAIQNLNDSEFQERTLKVRMAKDKVED